MLGKKIVIRRLFANRGLIRGEPVSWIRNIYWNERILSLVFNMLERAVRISQNTKIKIL